MEHTNLLVYTRTLVKLYDLYMEKIRLNYHFSHIEITIISFLHNNPGKDTAKEICDMRMLPKGNVSQGVESLIQKQLLVRQQDSSDRRKIHLSLTQLAIPIIEEIESAKAEFEKQIFDGLTKEELLLCQKINARIAENAKQGFKNYL